MNGRSGISGRNLKAAIRQANIITRQLQSNRSTHGPVAAVDAVWTDTQLCETFAVREVLDADRLSVGHAILRLRKYDIVKSHSQSDAGALGARSNHTQVVVIQQCTDRALSRTAC